VGDGAHQAALMFARHQFDLGDSVSFEGDVPAELLKEHMLWADVFLAPTVIDGLPEHVIEASAMALCVVMADPGPLGELEPEESVAITVARRDPDALADALAALALDPARRARMGTAARDWALDRFALDDHLDRLDDLYRRVLARKA
jgi:glycosyltransferase involved in cell wall biosynthesis